MRTARGGVPSRARSRGVELPPTSARRNALPPCFATRAAAFGRYSFAHSVPRGADRRRPIMYAVMSLASTCFVGNSVSSATARPASAKADSSGKNRVTATPPPPERSNLRRVIPADRRCCIARPPCPAPQTWCPSLLGTGIDLDDGRVLARLLL